LKLGDLVVAYLPDANNGEGGTVTRGVSVSEPTECGILRVSYLLVPLHLLHSLHYSLTDH
jgi:hypothetical protein